jgi:membrane associated rhomboid family serine protease
VERYLFSVPGEQYPWQLVTSMFLHGDVFHILGNSLFLWVFGVYVEDKVGWKVYLFLYFLTGIAAALVHGMIVGIFLRDAIFVPMLGASGAISGIMGVYVYRCYYSKIKLLIGLWLPIRVQLPAVAIIGLWFLKDLVGGIDALRGFGQGVAFWAHVGGLLAGLGACRYLRYGREARREKTEFVAETETDRPFGYGDGVEACEKLIKDEPENLEIHLKLARARSRWRASEEARGHYETVIKGLLKTDPKRAAEVSVEYWTKYMTVMEPRYQVSLCRVINQHIDADLSARILHILIDSDFPRDLNVERAYLDLAKIYYQLEKDDLVRYVSSRFLEDFPESEQRQLAETGLGLKPSGATL